jgi:hypothetical protein
VRRKRLKVWMHKGVVSIRGLRKLVSLAVGALTIAVLPLFGQDDAAVPPADPNSGAATPAPEADVPTGPIPADGSAPAASDDTITFQTFYDSLATMGTWIQTADYGYVWQPQVNDPDWAPYTNGHWVYTDAGWTWDSDEPWGWATYHYGRWVNLEGIGWVWVPGYTWAPAWVSWRYGDGFAGWAPLPPDSFVGVDYSDTGDDSDAGFHIGGDVDSFYDIGPAYYIFLPINCLGYRHYHGYYCHRGDNFAIINRTTNVTNLNVARPGSSAGNGSLARAGRFHHVTTGGPSLAQVNGASTTPMSKVTLVRASGPGAATLTGNSLAVYAPHVNPGSAGQPAQVAASIGQASINRGTDILQPLAVNSRLTPTAATEAQVQQARIALNHSPPQAKVVTDSSAFRPVLHTPLTTLKPMVRSQSSTSTFETPVNGNATMHSTSNPGGFYPTPSYRTYPQTAPGGNPNKVYQPGTIHPSGTSSFQPHAGTPGTGGEGTSHSYVRPSAPAVTPQAAPSAPTVVHQGSSGTPSSSATYSSAGGGAAPVSGDGGAGDGGAGAGGSNSGGGARGGGGSPGGGYQRH